jgi:hypothetical protein
LAGKASPRYIEPGGLAIALMMSKLYHALLAAHVPEEKAREAAEEAAELEISKIDDLATKADIAMVKGDIEAAKGEILKWVIGFMGLQTITIIGTLVVLANR